jgi:hypothetical protein
MSGLAADDIIDHKVLLNVPAQAVITAGEET